MQAVNVKDIIYSISISLRGPLAKRSKSGGFFCGLYFRFISPILNTDQREEKNGHERLLSDLGIIGHEGMAIKNRATIEGATRSLMFSTLCHIPVKGCGSLFVRPEDNYLPNLGN